MSTGRTPTPSPPWHGALFTAALFGGAGWLLIYTLLSVRPIDALGAWNYLVVLALILTATVVAARWRGDAA
ncbi:cell division protein CrgA [Actinomycetes bacterium KLBMP 9797]